MRIRTKTKNGLLHHTRTPTHHKKQTKMLSSSSSTDYQESLKLVRKIRDIAACGDGLSLPQICVVGDQSAGKSSFLSRLTGVAFPAAANMCTKVATVVNCAHDKTLSKAKYEIEQFDSLGNYIEVSDTASSIGKTQKSMLEISEKDIKSGQFISQEAMDRRNLGWLDAV